jgi:nucleoid-associated protein YgaU
VPPAEAGGTTYVVRPGDCLWTIAEAHLPGGSGAAAVADAWPAWYAANRDVVGPDPNLLRPGQSLTVPAAALVPTASTPLAAPAPSTSSTSSNPPVPEAAS